MPVPPRVVRWVEDHYKKPRVDPEWLNDCYEWLTTEAGHDLDRDFEGLVNAVENQILQSNFSDSMLPGTGFPTHVARPTTKMTLEGMHILVEVTAMTEIANSAFNLNQTRMAREERLQDGDVGDEEGEGDIDIAGEGPIPKYPRGMLKLHLTDGTITLPAMEYRPLPELSLENTPLGYKMILKDVRINRGIAFLEPKCVVMLGHKTDEREDNRQADFARGLRARMGLPEPPPDVENNPAPPPMPQNPPPQAPRHPSPLVARSPLREISPSPPPPAMYQGNDDEDLGRRRRIPHRDPDPPAPPRLGDPPSHTATTSSYFTNAVASSSRPRTVVGSGPSATPILSVSPTLRQTARPLYNSPPPPSPGPEDEHWWSDEADNQQRASLTGEQRFISDFGVSAVKFLDEVKARNAAQVQRGGNPQRNSGTVNRNGNRKMETGAGDMSIDSDEFDDDMVFDTDMLAQLDVIEAGKSQTTANPPPPSTVGSSSLSGSSAVGARSQSSVMAVERNATDVIIIEDDSDAEDKENVPVPTRHVRRRMAGGSASQGSGSGSQRARGPERPVVSAAAAADIIDLSDSDSSLGF
ncbi:hypothetical protein FPV67DRAFT_1667295 [Lyophyllum atratum]|nr:hypothetical protein FPV67DRAFT_1667295 [Lyophyllum atratum]